MADWDSISSVSAPAKDDPWAKVSTAAPKKSKARLDAEAEDVRWKASLKKDLDESGGLLENYGAGVNNLIQGAKQLFGKGESDEQIEERRKINQQLAEGQTGGGLAQLAGEVVTSAPLTAGVTGAVGKGLTMLPKVGNLIKSAGMAGGRTFNVGNVARATGEGALGGALQETTSDESRAANTLFGGAAGSVLPGAMAAASKTRQMLTKSGAPIRAAKAIEENIGREGIEDITDAAVSPTQTVLPLSTAARAQSVKGAAIERGSRGRGDWAFEHDVPVHESAWKEITDATKSADKLGGRIQFRDNLVQQGAPQSRIDAAEARIASSRAAQNVREAFVSPQGIQKASPIAGVATNVDSSVLRRTLVRNASDLDPAARQRLESLLKEVERHELYRPAKSPGVSTITHEDPSFLMSGRNNPVNQVSLLRGLLNRALKGSREDTLEAVDKAMRSPEGWTDMIDAVEKSKMPLDQREYLLRALRRGVMLPGQATAMSLGE